MREYKEKKEKIKIIKYEILLFRKPSFFQPLIYGADFRFSIMIFYELISSI